MHPVMILIPAAVLIFGPRAWVSYLLKKHNKKDLDANVTAREFVRGVLDNHKLQGIKIESTDIGDHYDHKAGAVRITRNRIDRKTLTALTTAAHEVSHALQDASDYTPFVLRAHLSKVAQVVSQVGSIMLVAVPLFSLTTRRPFPFITMGTTVFGILGTGLIAQLSALPSEFDASFNRALPMLKNGYIEEDEVKDARIILVACSMTYIAASMVSVLNFWPWFIGGAVASPTSRPIQIALLSHDINTVPAQIRPGNPEKPRSRVVMETLVRPIAKPLIRSWFKLSRTF